MQLIEAKTAHMYLYPNPLHVPKHEGDSFNVTFNNTASRRSASHEWYYFRIEVFMRFARNFFEIAVKSAGRSATIALKAVNTPSS